MKFDSLKRKLDAQITKYFRSEGYSSHELSQLKLFSISIEENNEEKYSDLYVYAELSIDEFFELKDGWGVLVESIDPSAYFDVVSPGIYMCRIYWDSANMQESRSNYDILSLSNLIKFGESSILELQDIQDEDFWLDDIYVDNNASKLYCKVSSNNYESEANIDINLDDIDSYQDIVTLYQDNLVDELDKNIVEL